MKLIYSVSVRSLQPDCSTYTQQERIGSVNSSTSNASSTVVDNWLQSNHEVPTNCLNCIKGSNGLVLPCCSCGLHCVATKARGASYEELHQTIAEKCVRPAVHLPGEVHMNHIFHSIYSSLFVSASVRSRVYGHTSQVSHGMPLPVNQVRVTRHGVKRPYLDVRSDLTVSLSSRADKQPRWTSLKCSNVPKILGTTRMGTYLVRRRNHNYTIRLPIHPFTSVIVASKSKTIWFDSTDHQFDTPIVLKYSSSGSQSSHISNTLPRELSPYPIRFM